MRELTFDGDQLAIAAADPLLLATDAAERLVEEGVPFRDAHERVAEDVLEGRFEPPEESRPRTAPGPSSIHEAISAARARLEAY